MVCSGFEKSLGTNIGRLSESLRAVFLLLLQNRKCQNSICRTHPKISGFG